MALLDFQTSLVRLVRAPNGSDSLQPVSLTADERGYLSDLTEDPAFRFTVKVQRSWCAGRAAKAAYLTLSILPGEVRDQLLEEWVSCGGGTHSFVGRESTAFLEFIASHLVEPSHELTICRMELAALRSSEGSLRFKRPNLSRIDRRDCFVRRGHYAEVVHFYGEPERVLNALAKRKEYPAISSEITTLIFGPGFDRLYTRATSNELALYDRLASPAAAIALSGEGFARETVQKLLNGGVIEYVG
jgi:hypothetical protein